MAEQRKLVNRIRFGATLEKSIYFRLKEYSEQTSIPITKILDKAVSMYLESVQK